VHALSSGDADVLGGLVVLGSAIGLGALLTPFRQNRDLPRDQLIGLTTFELFAAVTIFFCAILTAYLSLAYLHEGEALSSANLRGTATPLAVAGTFLLFLSVFSRMPDPLRQAHDHIPMMLGVLLLGLGLGFVMVSVPTGDVALAAIGLLVVGGAVGALAWWLERRGLRSARRAMRQELARLHQAGYRPQKQLFRLGLPRCDGAAPWIVLDCWVCDERSYLDARGCRRLRDEVDARWDALCSGNAVPPTEPIGLAEVRVPSSLRVLRSGPSLTVVIHDPSAPNSTRVRKLPPGKNGLFDVDELRTLSSTEGVT
jgi:hypothetical protein